MKHILYILSFFCCSTLFGQYTISQIPFAAQADSGITVMNLIDRYSNPLNIGFNFCFYGTYYDHFLIGDNGIIQFNTSLAGSYCTWPIVNSIPSPALPMNAIMAPFNDLYTGTIKYYTTGISPNKKCVISFDSLQLYGCSTLLVSSQVILYETTNEIETHILNKPICASWNGGRAIHGLHNANGTLADVVPGRNWPTLWSATNDGWKFSPNFTNCITSISDEEEIKVIQVFPNPFSSQTTIHFKNKLTAKHSKIILTNAIGIVVLQMAIENDQPFILHCESLQNGLYFLSFIQDDRIISAEKLIILN